MFEGSYPPGVTGKMIDQHFPDMKECCGICRHYDGEYCTRLWNNLDRDYCIPGRDAREEFEVCDEYEEE